MYNTLNKLHTSLGALKATKSPYIFCAKTCMLASPELRNSSQAIQNSTFSSLNSDFRNLLNNSNPPEIYKTILQFMLITSQKLENMERATRNGQSIDIGSIAQKETK